MTDPCCRHQNGFFPGVVLGAIIGAVGAYFLSSTEEGKEAKDKLKDLVADVEEKGEEFRKKVTAVQGEIKEKISGAKSPTS